MDKDLCSIRMHASLGGEHLSGAEQLVGFDDLQPLAATLLKRALEHERGCADQVRITIDPVRRSELVAGRLLPMRSLYCEDVCRAREAVTGRLAAAGVSELAAAAAIRLLSSGPAPGGGVMRGALLIDAVSGQRLESDSRRGVRVSRLGLAPMLRERFAARMLDEGLDPRRVGEAVVLASKVQQAPGVVAELCWSDDPSYVTGYVTTQDGYFRYSPLKEAGDHRGGRAFFVQPGSDLVALVEFLERTPFLVTELGEMFDCDEVLP